MSETQISAPAAQPEPLPDNIRSVQPGGGTGYRVEMAWGRVRRGWLKRFRTSYVQKMAERMRGDIAGAPHEILDPRDLKYCRNVCTAHWSPEDDPFRWRDALPLARWGLVELQLTGWPLLAATLALAVSPMPLRAVCLVPAALLALVVYFFRDPSRRVPSEPGCIVSPADGKVTEVQPIDHDDFVGGPAVKIGIFLSIFNVHVNRTPERATVLQLDYRPGKFLNAARPDSATENESMWIGLWQHQPPQRMAVRQISGLIARRIVCSLAPGQVVERGEKFGMIKFGSRTELVLAQKGLVLEVVEGQKVKAGSTVVARYASEPTALAAGASSRPPRTP